MSSDIERNGQRINEEVYPRHHHIGQESLRKLSQASAILKSSGVSLKEVPTILEVEVAAKNGGFPDKTIIGIATPVVENDVYQIIFFEGGVILLCTVQRYLEKLTGKMTQTQVVFDAAERKPLKGKPATYENHTKNARETRAEKRRKEKRGRQLSARI